jgi:predicted nucleic acid-binding protein
LEARGALSASRASQTAEDIANLQLTTYPIDALVPRIWALRNNLSIYDAWYIALAEALEAPLVTTDGRLERIPGVRCDIEVVSQRRS